MGVLVVKSCARLDQKGPTEACDSKFLPGNTYFILQCTYMNVMGYLNVIPPLQLSTYRKPFFLTRHFNPLGDHYASHNRSLPLFSGTSSQSGP